MKIYSKTTSIMFCVFMTLGFIFCAQISAEQYPSRLITIVVPYGAGGGVDITARRLLPYLEKELGQTVIVQNRTGAGGITGHTLGAFSAPDGYTLTMVSTGIVAVPWIIQDVRFTPNDYSYIGQVSYVPNFLLVTSKSPWKSVNEFIQYAKDNPGKLTRPGYSGWPSAEIEMTIFESDSGIKVRRIPGYEGGAQSLAAVLGGHLNYSHNNTNEVLPHFQAGTVRLLAGSGPKRSPFLPDVPTFSEVGFSGVTLGVWRALAVPSGTPQNIVDKLRRVLKAAMNAPGLAEEFRKVGLTVDYLDWEETTALILKQYDQLGELFKKLGVAVR